MSPAAMPIEADELVKGFSETLKYLIVIPHTAKEQVIWPDHVMHACSYPLCC